MLSREIMGAFCLAVLWLSALLVAAAAWQDLRDVARLWRRARRAIRARVEAVEPGDGAPDVLASWCVEQRGRALDSREDRIGFHDRAFRSAVASGTVRVDGRAYRVTGPGEVWPSAAARLAAAAGDPARFASAYAQATRAAGFERSVQVSIRTNDELFVLGEVSGDAIVGGDGPLVLSSFDAAPQLARQCAMIVAFIVAELAACAAVTEMVVAAPRFGPRSVVGALLCLGFYLGVTPLAVALRERVRRPSEAYLRGTWRRDPAT